MPPTHWLRGRMAPSHNVHNVHNVPSAHSLQSTWDPPFPLPPPPCWSGELTGVCACVRSLWATATWKRPYMVVVRGMDRTRAQTRNLLRVVQLSLFSRLPTNNRLRVVVCRHRRLPAVLRTGWVPVEPCVVPRHCRAALLLPAVVSTSGQHCFLAFRRYLPPVSVPERMSVGCSWQYNCLASPDGKQAATQMIEPPNNEYGRALGLPGPTKLLAGSTNGVKKTRDSSCALPKMAIVGACPPDVAAGGMTQTVSEPWLSG